MSSISRSSGSWIADAQLPFSLPSGRIRYLRMRSSGIRLTAFGRDAALVEVDVLHVVLRRPGPCRPGSRCTTSGRPAPRRCAGSWSWRARGPSDLLGVDDAHSTRISAEALFFAMRSTPKTPHSRNRKGPDSVPSRGQRRAGPGFDQQFLPDVEHQINRPAGGIGDDGSGAGSGRRIRPSFIRSFVGSGDRRGMAVCRVGRARNTIHCGGSHRATPQVGRQYSIRQYRNGKGEVQPAGEIPSRPPPARGLA